MVIDTTLNIGKYTVHLKLSSLHKRDSNYCFQFGQGDDSLQSYGSLHLGKDFVDVTTDYFSGQRIYYWYDPKEDSIYITDSVNNYISPEVLDSLEKCDFECTLFKKHGYTSGNATVYEQIKKIPPATTLRVSSRGIELKSNWNLGKIVNNPSKEEFEKAIYEAVKKSFTELKDINRPIVLCFSGGKDSTYLAYILNELNIPYDMVFFRDPTLKVNNKEIKTARKQALKLGKNLKLINIQEKKEDKIEDAIKQFQKFDNHYCKYHFYGLAGIKKIYGPEVIIINGQNSDSILSFGPSEEKFSSKVKRYLLYGKNKYIKKLIAHIIGTMFRQKLKVPETNQEYLDAFYDNYKYCILLDKRTQEFTQSLHEQITFASSLIGEENLSHNLLMYLKAYTHMQASDAQVVTQSAKYHGLDLIMPLANEDIMAATLQFKDDNIELSYPKYPLDFICKRLSH